MYFKSSVLGVTCVLAGSSYVSAHSWVEEATVVAPNGTFIGAPGFPRGKVDRSAPGWNNGDMTFLVPPNGGDNTIQQSQAMCQYPNPEQENNKPVLSASAGDRIALRYLENGHVTKPDISGIKPKNSGTVFVYGTTKPLATDKYLDIHNKWNADGTGGDKRGVLLAAQPFDDGQCYEANGSPVALERQAAGPKEASAQMGPSLWCQSDLTLPEDIKDTYTLYWVWDWPTLDKNGKVILNEAYTTCMDLDITSASNKANKKAVSFAKGQDLNFAAIASELTNNFNAPTTGFTGPSGTATSPAASATSPGSPVSESKSKSEPSKTSAAGASEVTVTVTTTASGEIQYVTVTATVTKDKASSTPTKTPAGGAADAPPKFSTSAMSPSSTSTSASPSKATGGAPNVQPFLGTDGEPTSVALSASQSSAYTNGTLAATGSPKLRVRHARRHRVSNLFS
ncbi:hypothetical protein PVAG01_06348 [Phlyctema vagabunda]|uniref:DUF7492 domain-containing protein n=1 Tax=Phlyctema vagabunda TaxID=108571 RepID=A0ABR4PFS8_9HELO